MSDQKFDPMREINNLRQSVTKAIEHGIQSVQNATNPPNLRVDVYELQDVIVVRTSALDGLVASSIEVSMEENELTISGITQPDDTPAEASYLVQERRFGAFSRTVAINVPVRPDEAKAKVKNGSLTITLPIDRSHFSQIRISPE